MRERIEDFLDRTERVQLLAAPTPLHALSGFSEYKDVQAYIKRDDMTGLGPGGNKVRSLEYILGEAVSIGCKKILAAGPVQSNLCTLTAAACARLGLECELVHNGEEPEKKEGNLLLNGLLGTVSHFLGSCDSSERNAYTEELAASYEKAGIPSYVVRNGATTGRGALGYTAAVREMKRQCEEMQIHNNPPRKGCDEKCLETMVAMAPERIVYVSCDSATLARDLKYLQGKGYEVLRVRPVDQFCHSMHVETVVLLTKVQK